MCPTAEEQRILRLILTRADYATSEIQAADGDAHLVEVTIIRRIEAATIPTMNYPASKRQRSSFDLAALSAWESEGGSGRSRVGRKLARSLPQG
ncbi:hypothetical protein ELH88_26965 (plasmid) [Rhizobium ruizarguesonis]|nr:hypothetical protein ELH87_30015 [Rhizobium ruizarguesonis]TAY44748.1 hypothetical protein ELH88_26965 [Rhizobium ruizarguesonis]